MPKMPLLTWHITLNSFRWYPYIDGVVFLEGGVNIRTQDGYVLRFSGRILEEPLPNTKPKLSKDHALQRVLGSLVVMDKRDKICWENNNCEDQFRRWGLKPPFPSQPTFDIQIITANHGDDILNIDYKLTYKIITPLRGEPVTYFYVDAHNGHIVRYVRAATGCLNPICSHDTLQTLYNGQQTFQTIATYAKKLKAN